MKSNNKVKSIIKDFNDGKAANAFFQIADLIKNNPENLDYLFLYAKMCNQVNKLDESEKASLFLVSKNKNSVDYLHNLYSVYSSMKWRQPENRKIANLAEAIGLKSYSTNGYNLSECSETLKDAVGHVRSDNGPAFVEASTYRYREHCGPNYDNEIGYRTVAEYERWRMLDPIVSLRDQILTTEENGSKLVEKVEKRLKSDVLDAFNFAMASEFPDRQRAFEGVYSKSI